jgi:hypothetical protein
VIVEAIAATMFRAAELLPIGAISTLLPKPVSKAATMIVPNT